MPTAILLENVDGVGAKGSVVDVSKGYLRNFLIPRNLGAPATKGLIVQAQRQAVAAEQAARNAIAGAQETAAVLNKTVLTIEQQAGEDGRLFGSVTAQDIADAIKDARGVEIDRHKVQIEEPIKTVGTHSVVVEIAKGVDATVKIIVSEA